MRAGSVKAGDTALVRLIPLRGSDLSLWPAPQAGSFNASPGREFVCGNAGDRMADTIRRWALSKPTTKSSTAKGGKPLPGKTDRRRCQTAIERPSLTGKGSF